MPTTAEYKQLINEIIKKQILVLGPDIALVRARQIAGLTVDGRGTVLKITAPEQEVLQQLIDKYIELSGEIVKNILNPVFAKYPGIDVKIK